MQNIDIVQINICDVQLRYISGEQVAEACDAQSWCSPSGRTGCRCVENASRRRKTSNILWHSYYYNACYNNFLMAHTFKLKCGCRHPSVISFMSFNVHCNFCRYTGCGIGYIIAVYREHCSQFCGIFMGIIASSHTDDQEPMDTREVEVSY